MARTTDEQVRTIIDVITGHDLTAYIEAASSIIDSECTASEYPPDKFEMIERYLAAHFYACRKRRTAAEGVDGGADQSFDRIEVDLGLNNTLYGQQAIMLDTDGNLAAMVNAMKDVKKVLPGSGAPQIVWLGRTCR